jgi:hypothetical protein
MLCRLLAELIAAGNCPGHNSCPAQNAPAKPSPTIRPQNAEQGENLALLLQARASDLFSEVFISHIVVKRDNLIIYITRINLFRLKIFELITKLEA